MPYCNGPPPWMHNSVFKNSNPGHTQEQLIKNLCRWDWEQEVRPEAGSLEEELLQGKWLSLRRAF